MWVVSVRVFMKKEGEGLSLSQFFILAKNSNISEFSEKIS